MDKLSKNTKNNSENNPEKISLKFSKGKEQWSINKPEALAEKSKKNNNKPETKKSAPNTKINCKVSIPLSRVPNCWKTLGIKMTHKMPPYVRMERLRLPPAPIQPMKPPPVSTPNATKLSNYRHPVPTNTVRTIMVDKLEKVITETRTKKIEIKPIAPVRIPYRREIDAKQKLPVCTAPDNIRTEISDHQNNIDTNLTISTAIQTERTFMIGEADFKTLQIIKGQNITEKDIHILEVVKTSGMKEDEFIRQIEKIKKRKGSNNCSDDMVIDVEKHFESTKENNLNLEKLIRQSEQNKNVLVNRFIALARLAAASRQPPQPGTSTLETVTASHEISPMQSAQTNASPGTNPSAVTCDQIITTSEARTPTALETLSEVACAEKRKDVTATTPVRIENSFQPTVISNELLRGPIDKIPIEDSSAFASLAPTAIEETYRNNGPCNDLLSQTAKTPTAFQTPGPANSFARAYPERIENMMAFRISRTRPNRDDALNSNSNLQTQNMSNSLKRKAAPDHHTDNIATRYQQIHLPQPQTGTARPIVQELRQNEAVVQQVQQQQQELSMFQQIPVHVRQPQMRYAGPGRHDRSELRIVRARQLQQQRAQYQQMRIQYEQSRPTLNAPHMAPQQPQMSPVQLYSCEIRHPLPSQVPIASARRVFSTEEANIHGQAVQRGRNWHYPVFYDRNGNCWPRPHDFSQ